MVLQQGAEWVVRISDCLSQIRLLFGPEGYIATAGRTVPVSMNSQVCQSRQLTVKHSFPANVFNLAADQGAIDVAKVMLAPVLRK
jgi:hypothetical protein